MKTSTGKDIIEYISKNQQSTVKELVDHFGYSQQAIQRQLKKLVETGTLAKVGTPPKVYYLISKNWNLLGAHIDETKIDLYNSIKKDFPNVEIQKDKFNKIHELATNLVVENQFSSVEKDLLININDRINNFIENNFTTVINGNQIVEGVDAFQKWCIDRSFDFYKTAQDYYFVVQKNDGYRNNNGLVNATNKFQTTFNPSYLDKAYYIDFYSIERFGKTKLGTYILYAKQSQSIQLMKEVFKMVDEPIMKLIESEKIDAVGFIPPTISRKIQFMTELKRMLAIELPEIKITKIKTSITIAQKTLSKLSEREDNAKNTIFIDDKRKFKNILLIDDAVGSGATFNEVAKKIRAKGIVSGNIIGLALIGSANGIVDHETKKGFPVINEV